MKKSEIKPGMIIVNELNQVQIVIENPKNGKPCSVGYERYNSRFKNYPEDLNTQDKDRINIICVGKFKQPLPIKMLEEFLNTHNIKMFEYYIDILWKTEEDFYKDTEEKIQKRNFLDAIETLHKAICPSDK